MVQLLELIWQFPTVYPILPSYPSTVYRAQNRIDTCNTNLSRAGNIVFGAREFLLLKEIFGATTNQGPASEGPES